MKKMKGIIFDFNGTLFWDTPKHEIAWLKLSEELRGIPFKEEEIAEHLHGQINSSIIQYLCGESMSKEQIKAHSLRKEAIYRELCMEDPDFVHLAPGAEALFNWLKERRIPQTIATASIKENVDFFIETFHLTNWFDPAYITYDDGINKDKTEMFLKAANAIEVPIEECVIIEDSLSGIHFAQEVHAGMIIALCPSAKRDYFQQLPGVDLVIQDFHDFDTNIFEVNHDEFRK